MSTAWYSKFLGMKRGINLPDAPQMSWLLLENYLMNQIVGAPVKRGGSVTWTADGDILGVSSYSKKNTSYRVPNVSHIVRHRRDGSTSYIERLDWSSLVWTAITQGANVTGNIGTDGIAQFPQYFDFMAVLAGRPAKITDITGGTLSRLGGPAPTTAPTWGSSAGPLTGSTWGFYTFYDPTTGWESSPSPLTALTTFAAKQIDWSALETTCAREGVTKKRLYRTQIAAEGEPPYYFVAEINLATTTYADTVTDANLLVAGPDFDDHDPPPSSYVGIFYANCLWIASGNELWRSKPFDGAYPNLEYFSLDRVFYFPHKITALAYAPDFGRLLVFLPRGQGVHYVSGRSESTFEQDILQREEGTDYTMSVSIYQNKVAFWGTNGPTILTPQGIVEGFSEDLQEYFRDIVAREYNSDIFITSVWHPVQKQFLFFFAATDSGDAAWQTPLGIDTFWEDSTNGAVVEWGE